MMFLVLTSHEYSVSMCVMFLLWFILQCYDMQTTILKGERDINRSGKQKILII